MQFSIYQEDRSTVLIATFKDGYTADWRFALPVSFREVLDIKLTERQHLGKTVLTWTQGRLFSIFQGSMMYDTRLAYELEWGEALKHIGLALQVKKASPCEYRPSEIVETKSPIVDIITTKPGQPELPVEKTLSDGLKINRIRYYPGRIDFVVLKPSPDKTTVAEVETIECSQEQFISFLQTGRITTKDHPERDLFKEHSIQRAPALL
jgi:hypothetical protein